MADIPSLEEKKTYNQSGDSTETREYENRLAAAYKSLENTVFVIDIADFSVGSFDNISKSWPIDIHVDIENIQFEASITYSIKTAGDIDRAYYSFKNAIYEGKLAARILLIVKPDMDGRFIVVLDAVELMFPGNANDKSENIAVIPIQRNLFRVHPDHLGVLDPWIESSESVFRIYNGTEPRTLDPSKIQSIPEHQIYMALFEGLVGYDPKTSLATPGLAESWTVNPDGTQLTFKLRKATWSDGTKITAKTVVDSWIHILSPKTASEFAYIPGMVVKGASDFNRGKAGKEAVAIRAIDDNTFQCDLIGPMPYAIDMMAHYAFAVLPMHVITAKGDDWTKKENIVTNGPFKLLEWKPRKVLTVVKSDKYWDAENVKLKKIYFLLLENNLIAHNLYNAGEIDWVSAIPLERIDEIKYRPDYYVSPQFATYYYMFNMTRKPFDDVRVRKALAKSLDMQELVNKVTKGGQIATTSMVPEITNYTPSKGPTFNVEEARRLLTEAGFPEGTGFPKVPILYNTNDSHKKIAEWVQASWKKNLGIDVSLVNKDWKTFLDTRTNMHDFFIARAGWVGDYLDPNTFLDMFITDSGINDGLYSNPEYDALVNEASTMKPGVERMDILHKAETILVSKDQAVIPFYHYVSQDIIDLTKWSGWYPNVSGVHNPKYLRTQGRFEDSLLIGGMMPLTGDAATFGDSTKKGLQLAVDEWNAKGGVLGKQIKLVLADDKGNPAEGATVFTKLIQRDRVVAIVGSIMSKVTLAAAPIAQASKIPVITPTSTNVKVTQVGDYIYRACFIDPFQGTFGAKFAFNDLGAKVAGILFDVGNDYCRGLAESFKKSFEALGGQVVMYTGHQTGTSDYRPHLIKILAGKPDVIYCSDYYNDAALIAKQARELGYTGPIVGGDGFDSPDYAGIGGAAVNNTFFTNHYTTDATTPAVKAFVSGYKAKYGATPDILAALAYEAGNILINAIKSAGKTDGESIKNALAMTDLAVVTGQIHFDEHRNPIKSAVIIKIEDGKQTFYTTIDP